MKDLSQNHDGYHTFEELYNDLTALLMFIVNQNISLFTKSMLHADGSSWPNFFILTGQLITGQISYHISLSYWHSFKCEETDKAPEWDGHTSDDVVNIIKDYATNYLHRAN